MSRRQKKGQKVRVQFRQNRTGRTRSDDWTRRYLDDQERLIDEQQRESIRAKGELSRKRTIIVDDQDAPLVDESEWRPGVVTAMHGLIVSVDDADGRCWDCTVRRVLRTMLIEQRSSVVVGDRVWLSDQSANHDGATVGVIERVESRQSRLSRRDRRGREHTIVANADQLLIVASVAQPRLKPHLIDRYLVAAANGDLRPIVVLNKWDLLPERCEHARKLPMPDRRTLAAAEPDVVDDEFDVDLADEDYTGPTLTIDDVTAEVRALGYTCFATSAVTGLGIDQLRAELADRVTVLSGQSGVGKSSLINKLQPGMELATADVSDESEKGRHTTTLARLLRLDFGGYVVDTPGIRSFDLWDVDPGELEAFFVEFQPLLASCKFKDCHHTGVEPDCAVRQAVDDGAISPRRYASYLKMLEEMAQAKRR